MATLCEAKTAFWNVSSNPYTHSSEEDMISHRCIPSKKASTIALISISWSYCDLGFGLTSGLSETNDTMHDSSDKQRSFIFIYLIINHLQMEAREMYQSYCNRVDSSLNTTAEFISYLHKLSPRREELKDQELAPYIPAH